MVTLNDRRNHWCKLHGVDPSTTTLSLVDGVLYVPDGQPFTEPELLAYLEQDVQDYLEGLATANAARIAEDAEIAQAIIDGSLSTMTYEQLEAATLGESLVIRKMARVTWALLKDYNRRNLI